MNDQEAIDILQKHDVYYELALGRKPCYKFQPKGEDVIIIVKDNQGEAAIEMYEILKAKNIL